MNNIFAVLRGRTTTFALFFAFAGTGLQCVHRLDATYITFMTTLMTFVVGHSIKEDVVKAKQVQQ